MPCANCEYARLLNPPLGRNIRDHGYEIYCERGFGTGAAQRDYQAGVMCPAFSDGSDRKITASMRAQLRDLLKDAK